MLIRVMRFACCVVAALLFVATAAAADFLDQPKVLCDYFESLGMKAQFRWGPAPRGDAYLCQYADEFGGSTRQVRGARVYVNPESGKVGLGLSIQGLQLVRGEAVGAMEVFAESFYQAHGQSMPGGLMEAVAADDERTLNVGAFSLSSYGGALWER